MPIAALLSAAVSVPAAPGGPKASAASGGAALSSGPSFDIPEAHRKLLLTRNLFVHDPPSKPVPPPNPPTPTVKDTSKFVYVPPATPKPDPADYIVLTGAFEIGGTWSASVEELQGKRSQLVSVGETLAGAPDWQVAAISADKVSFRVRGRTEVVTLGSNLTGRNGAAVGQLLSAGHTAAPAALIPTSPVAAVPGGGLPSSSLPSAGAVPMSEDRINLASGISDPEAGRLREYFRDHEDRSSKKGKGRDRDR